MNRRALVVGLGIAGMSAAKGLAEGGWETTVVERSRGRRTGGHFVALFESGASSARRLGILADLSTRSDPDSRTWNVDRSGNRRLGAGYGSLAEPPRILLRSDVEEALWSALPGSVRVRFGTMPTALRQDPSGVTVSLRTRDGAELPDERYDLVVGADGVHSGVRRLVFGPDENLVRNLGYMMAATLLTDDQQIPCVPPGDGATLLEPGRSVWAFPLAGMPPSLMFSYRTDDVAAELAHEPGEALRRGFGGRPSGEFLTNLIGRYERSQGAIFEPAQQVLMRRWCDGRVALVGDAAWNMTPYSGLGASAAIAGGELLGTLLRSADADVAEQLQVWNDRMYPFVHYQHRTIDDSVKFFIPSNRREHLQRRVLTRFRSVWPVSTVLARKLSSSESFRMKAVDVAGVESQPVAAPAGGRR